VDDASEEQAGEIALFQIRIKFIQRVFHPHSAQIQFHPGGCHAGQLRFTCCGLGGFHRRIKIRSGFALHFLRLQAHAQHAHLNLDFIIVRGGYHAFCLESAHHHALPGLQRSASKFWFWLAFFTGSLFLALLHLFQLLKNWFQVCHRLVLFEHSTAQFVQFRAQSFQFFLCFLLGFFQDASFFFLEPVQARV